MLVAWPWQICLPVLVSLATSQAGRIPTLVYNDRVVLFESAAICLQLADLHPEAALVPRLGTEARGQFYQWLMFLTNTVQPTLMAYHYPATHTSACTDTTGSTCMEKAVVHIRSRAEDQLGEWFGIIEAALSDGRGYLAGGSFSAVDYYLLMLCRWGRGLQSPPRNLPHLGALLQRVAARPAAQRALATEGLAPPIY